MIFNSYAEQSETLAGIRLVSCGHVFANPKREIYRPNGRSDWLLLYIAKESETFFFNQVTVANAGSAILFAPREKQHHIYDGEKTAEFYYVHFQCETLPQAFSLETSRIYTLTPCEQIIATFETIIEETLQKNVHYEILSISKLLEILSLIQRQQDKIEGEKKEPWNSIARAVQHMNRYYNSNLKLNDYAQMCNMSKYHFLRVFKQVTGTTPLEYRSEIRIRQAKELLVNSFLSVSEIAVLLGYTSSSYFSDAFKKHMGIPPIDYRKRHSS